MHFSLNEYILMALVVCSCNQNPSYTQENSSITDSTRRVENEVSDSIKQLFYLPKSSRTKSRIDSIVANTDHQKLNGELISERSFGIDDMPCEIVNYGNAHQILKTEYGCGDCSNTMTRTEFYYESDTLIHIINRFTEFMYPPCISKVELDKDYNIDTLKLDDLTHQRMDYYYFKSHTNMVHLREGDSIQADWANGPLTTAEEWLDQAIKVTNYQEPENHH